MRHALITGVTGQDGAYLSKLLLEHGYKVYGLDRRTSTPTTERLYYLEVADRVVLLDGDVTDQGSMVRALEGASGRVLDRMPLTNPYRSPRRTDGRAMSARTRRSCGATSCS